MTEEGAGVVDDGSDDGSDMSWPTPPPLPSPTPVPEPACDGAGHKQQVKECRSHSADCLAGLAGLNGEPRKQVLCAQGDSSPCGSFFNCVQQSLESHHCTRVRKYTRVLLGFRWQCDKEQSSLSECEANRVDEAVETGSACINHGGSGNGSSGGSDGSLLA